MCEWTPTANNGTRNGLSIGAGRKLTLSPTPRSPVEIMADVEFLYRSYPLEVRSTDPDPEKLGIQDMRRVLALYERKLQSRSSARRSD